MYVWTLPCMWKVSSLFPMHDVYTHICQKRDHFAYFKKFLIFDSFQAVISRQALGRHECFLVQYKYQPLTKGMPHYWSAALCFCDV